MKKIPFFNWIDIREKNLFKCDNCMAFYEVRSRAEKCHYGDVAVYRVKLKRIADYKKRGEQQ